MPESSSGALPRTRSPIAFVEDKRPDFSNVARYLAISAEANRWSNFGPLCGKLKARLETLLELPTGRSAVPCASGTHALFAAAALAERNGPLRWIAPDYAFRATAIGPFAGAQFVDCNPQGAFDADLLSRVGTDSYDGIVALNPFGLKQNLAQVISFARDHGKTLIIDNAPCLLGFDRRDHAGIFECISLHHTKPMGFGEGGCLVVDSEFAPDAERALDFGYQWRWKGGKQWLGNGKMSEPAAAFLLDHLERAPARAEAYRGQLRRISGIAEPHGFRLLTEDADIGGLVPGNVPLLAPAPVSREDAENELLTTRKYYAPITGRPTAADIYAKILNVPCHPGVAELSDQQMSTLFARWAESALRT
jgi:dTDP-4-amino-4,6-dideoxygalactose transaminase